MDNYEYIIPFSNLYLIKSKYTRTYDITNTVYTVNRNYQFKKRKKNFHFVAL